MSDTPVLDNERCDLRILSLLYGVGDKEELIREALRLLMEPNMDDVTWIKVRNLGRCLAPEHQLFSAGRKIAELRQMFPAGAEMQVWLEDDGPEVHRSLQPERGFDERRHMNLAWVGVERRRADR